VVEGLFALRRRQLLAFSPETCGHSEGINLVLLPPQSFVSGCMVLLMVDGTERDGEFVTNLKPKSPRLCEADVMGVARRSPANDAGCWATKRKCSLQRIRLGSLIVSVLLSILVPTLLRAG
jgi:hypothetical protein